MSGFSRCLAVVLACSMIGNPVALAAGPKASSRPAAGTAPGGSGGPAGPAASPANTVPANTAGVASGGAANSPAVGATEVNTPNGNAITLNFKDADIDSVVGAFGHLLNKTFIIDPRVRGKITLETPKPVSRNQAYQLLQSTLRMQGFSIVESGPTVIKLVPEADAKLQSGPIGGRAAARGGDQILTQVFNLQFESASNLVGVLRPLISPNNTITAYPNNNQLVVTDYAANLLRIGRIISTLDSPGANEVEVLPIKYAIASEVALTVARMVDDSNRVGAGAQVDPGQRVLVMADPRSNTIMIRAASPAKIALAKSLISRIDLPSATPGNVNVVYLRNAEAVRLAQVLRSVLTGGDTSGNLGGTNQSTLGGLSQTNQPNQPGGANNPLGGQTSGALAPLQPSTNQPGSTSVSAGGAIIAADSATNSLIITAPEPVYRNLRAVIEKLDARRAQVFIESLIVEVSAQRAAELGIQWQFLNPGNGETRVLGGTNLTGRGSGTNILDAAQNLGSLGGGLNLGVVRGTTTIQGVGTILNLGLLARALETESSANILATPNLLTLDNEEARIIIGQNVPFVTGQFTTPSAGGAVNPFQTVERRDVGTTLRVRPQVSEAGTVRMQIFQEVSSVQDRTLSAGLITNRRAIESNVLVDDGQIVVLGGLIEERVEGANEKIPGLGDIPFLGNLFRYDTRKRVKTNLLVFLRPIVIRDAGGAYSVTADRYDYIRQLRVDSRQTERWGLGSFQQGQLPPMPAAPVGTNSGAPGNLGPGGQIPRAPAPLMPSLRDDPAVRQGLGGLGSGPTGPGVAGTVAPGSDAGVIRTAPNEVIVPLSRPGEAAGIRPNEPPNPASSGNQANPAGPSNF
jgi:general secretion pathway protein D